MDHRSRPAALLRAAIAILSVAAGIGIGTPPALATAPDCSTILPPAVVQRSDTPVTSGDLVRLRDIGYESPLPFDSWLALSPDKRQVAFVVHRGDPAANGYCVALVVMETRPGARARVIDQNDSLILANTALRNLYSAEGYPATILPHWSPDGRSLAYLKRTNGITQAWRVAADGSGATRITQSPVDIDLLAWSGDGRALLVASRPGLIAAARALDAEGRRGFLYDDRIIPNSGARPQISLPIPYRFEAIDIGSGISRPATPAEQALLVPPRNLETVDRATAEAIAPGGARARISARNPKQWMTPMDLWAVRPDGTRVRCDAAACQGTALRGIGGLWWLPGGRDLLFQRIEGWDFETTALYRWTPGQVPRRILATTDELSGCEMALTRLLCRRDGSVAPRRLVLIDPGTGSSQLLFNPNPEFDAHRLGTVQRLHWRNDIGLEVFGDLVLPPDYTPGQRLPLIVEQYISRGFLRGGTGDEFPIQPFAARGYAVLSIQKPIYVYESRPDPAWRSWVDAEAENQRNWNERRSKLSAILKGVDLLVSLGVADPGKVGITGLSDGATSTRFALVNAPGRFAAAALGTCCFDGDVMMALGGTAVARERIEAGFPPASDITAWKQHSLNLSADRVTAPVLMQLSDEEFIHAVQAYAALRDHHKPVELYVFPDEHHIKWQPAHRLAIYERNIDWFDYWLRDRRDPDPGKAAQYVRWDQLKLERGAAR